MKKGNLLRKRDFALTTRGMGFAARRTARRERGRAGMGGQVSQLFSYRFTFVITRRVAARRMSKINGSHLELFPRTFAFFFLSLHLALLPARSLYVYSFLFPRYRYTVGIYN